MEWKNEIFYMVKKGNETENEILLHLLRWLKNITFANNCITSGKI